MRLAWDRKPVEDVPENQISHYEGFAVTQKAEMLLRKESLQLSCTTSMFLGKCVQLILSLVSNEPLKGRRRQEVFNSPIAIDVPLPPDGQQTDSTRRVFRRSIRYESL